MSDEVVTTPEDDAAMADTLANAHYVENDGQMHDVTFGGDADEAPDTTVPGADGEDPDDGLGTPAGS